MSMRCRHRHHSCHSISHVGPLAIDSPRPWVEFTTPTLFRNCYACVAIGYQEVTGSEQRHIGRALLSHPNRRQKQRGGTKKIARDFITLFCDKYL
ncbi:hypothetical protein Hanom_Chr08g00748141 [Helianthus anomalus]